MQSQSELRSQSVDITSRSAMERIEQLEQQCAAWRGLAIDLRRTRRIFCLVMVLPLVVAFFAGAQIAPDKPTEKLTAKKLILCDSTGRERIILDADGEQHGAVLKVLDENGKGGINIGVGEFGTGISHTGFSIRDKNERPRLIMGTGPTGSAGLRLLDENFSTRYGFLIGPDNQPIITVPPKPDEKQPAEKSKST